MRRYTQARLIERGGSLCVWRKRSWGDEEDCGEGEEEQQLNDVVGRGGSFYFGRWWWVRGQEEGRE